MMVWNLIINNILIISIILLIIINATLAVSVNRLYGRKKIKNKFWNYLIIVALISISVAIVIFAIPSLQDRLQYNMNKPSISFDIWEIPSPIQEATLGYSIPENYTAYMVVIQNLGNSTSQIKQINLDIYFNGFIKNYEINFQSDVSDVRLNNIPVARFGSSIENFDYEKHSLVIENMLPGGIIAEQVVIEPNYNFEHYKMGKYDLQWVWELNSKDRIEFSSSSI